MAETDRPGDGSQNAKQAEINRRLEEYLPLVKSRVRAFAGCGVEADDLFQEGLLGLFSAIRAYRPDRGASFETFAYLCVTNRLRTAVSAAGRKAAEVSFDQIGESEGSPAAADPQELLAGLEDLARWRLKFAERLSEFERRAMGLFLAGYSYEEIAASVHASVKSVDNALARARRKLRSE